MRQPWRNLSVAGSLSIVAILSACSAGPSLDLEDYFSADTEPWYLITDAQEATGELCDEETACVQAYTTEHTDFLRFDSPEQAEEAAGNTAGDTRVSDSVLIRFSSSSLIEEEKDAVQEWLEHESEPDADLGPLFADPTMGWYLESNPRETTALLCADGFDCDQAYSTDQADYLMFETPEEAASAASEVGADAEHVNHFVIHFTDERLTESQRAALSQALRCAHGSDDSC
ncbi:hypothetical protein [Nocardiopsis valliformis]|uniref:hypothetical protein n=1 Tax=Nocardiopsis valliformis TaxID=239974 RepID=UPI00037FA886|nr:hypothetical protein [Nocardiopsis valliformis]